MEILSKKEIQLELTARKIVKRKLESAIKSLDKPIAKIVAEREKRKETLMMYKNEEELRDAYGWEFITEEEFYSLLDQFRNGTEAIDAEVSAQERAKDILRGWLSITYGDISSFEFDLLPEKKKQKIREENERILKEREERMKRRNNYDQP